MPRIKERCLCRRPTTTTYPPSDDDDSHDDELAELRAKEAQRRALQRACQARYRARHPDRIAAQKRRYRAKRRTNPPRDLDELAELRAREERRLASKARYRARYPDRIAAQNRRYREKNRAKLQEAGRRYYQSHKEKVRASQKQYRLSQRGRLVKAQYQLKRRKAIALAARERRRTGEKLQALGPLKLTVTLEDFMRDFHDSLASTPEDSVDKDQPCASDAMTITDMDPGSFCMRRIVPFLL